jgi:hypothetical protein
MAGQRRQVLTAPLVRGAAVKGEMLLGWGEQLLAPVLWLGDVVATAGLGLRKLLSAARASTRLLGRCRP